DGGIVFPRIIDGCPTRRTSFGKREAPERINLIAHAREGDMVRGKPHRPLLCPLIGGGIILEHQRLRLPARREPAEDIELSVGGGAEELFRWIGKWRALYPGLHCGRSRQRSLCGRPF